MEPSSSRTVVFRTDAAPCIGAGHVARCLSLAETFGAEGWRCRLACRAETPETAPAIARCFRETLILEGVEEDEARAIAARWPEGCDLLVVDHYGRAAPFEEALRPWARAILAIDDLCRAHRCDYLLDPTPGRVAGDYAGRVPQGCEVYLGPAYVPLKSVFAERRARALARRRKPGPVELILVSLGATDPANLTAFALGGIVRSGLKPAVEIVLGPVAPHREEVRAQAAALDLDVTVHEGLEDLADPMSRADLAIGAAGITSWERCCLGLPSVLVVTAGNQRETAEALERAGAAVSLGWHSAVGPERIAAAVLELDRDPARRARMGAKAAALCDGRGARRVGMEILSNETARDGRPVRLRPATMADARIMLRWQCDPRTRRYARNPAPPAAEEHQRWLADRLADPGCLFNLILHGDAPAGVLRLDRIDGDQDLDNTYEVSILVAPDRHRLGIGRAALHLVRQLLPEAELRAEVLPGNVASDALFRSAGFIRRKGLFYSPPEAGMP